MKQTPAHTTLSKQSRLSRRRFISNTGLLLAGIAIQTKEKISSAPLSAADESEKIIDIHQHLDYAGRDDAALLLHQQAMGVSKTILHPAGRPAFSTSTHDGIGNGLQAGVSGSDRAYRFALQHADRFMFAANELPDYPHAVRSLEKYLKKGAVAIGEQKFGVDCDSKVMQNIYALAGEYNVPVLLHFQFEMYNYGLNRFHKMLEKFPKVNFIGHAQAWWANIDQSVNPYIAYPKGKVNPGGITDRLLSDYSNMFGDLSAGSGLNSMTRDEDHARDFLNRHQNKLMFGSDCIDKTGSYKDCAGARIIDAIRRLSPDKQAAAKIYCQNAERVFRIKA